MFLPLQITKCYPHERRKSRHSDNNVRYHYGTAEETPSRRGRLWLVEDASGGIEYFFGNIGEIIKEIRTIRISPTEIQTYVTESEYDSWNRIQKLTYPDGEILDYGYNRAGKLNKLLASSKKPIANSIIEQQGYDEFEQKVYRRFGNGIETHYTYDPVMRRLVQLKAEANRQSPTAPLQNNHYQYDLVGNILSIENAISQSPMAISQLGGSSRYAYEYDVLNRLTKASGQYNGSRNTAEYELNMSYNALNGITQKALKHTVNGIDKGYTLNYEYNNPNHPNAPSVISGFAPLGGQGDRRYTYDGNGNPTGYEEFKSFRMMVWDEENRLRGINDNGLLHLYTYDHTGERTLKSSSETSQTMINGATAAIITHNEDYTAYVSPYFVVQKGRFTKHYFEGASRISSKLGEGTFTQNGKGITAGGIDYLKQTALLDEALRNYIKNLNTPPGPPTQQGIYASPEWTGQPYPSIDWEAITQNQEPPEGWPRPPKFNEPGDVPGPPVQYGDPITPENVEAGFNFVDNGIEEKNIYYYHPDHLGSSSHITDINGNLSQHTEFMAFGEVLFDEHSTSITQPYLFNGKELDSETNLTYYGARYLDMKTSLWLNVDPLVERTLQPYQYANNNPVMFIDPDGRCYTRADNGDYIPCAPPIKDVTFATKLESSKPIITYNYGVNQTDAFGNDWTFTKNDAWELVNANSHPNYSQKVTIAPTGDASYYEQRYTAHIETYGTTPPDYYLSYGHKYANKFTKELRGELSDAGKKWIDQTVNELQVQMNTFIDGNPSIQGNNDTFRTKAFDTHVPAYTKDNLLKNLPFKDKVKIGLTPDFRDLTSPDGMKQVRQIIPKIF